MAFLGCMFYEVVTDDGALNTTTTSQSRSNVQFKLKYNRKKKPVETTKELRSSKGRVIA